MSRGAERMTAHFSAFALKCENDLLHSACNYTDQCLFKLNLLFVNTM